MSRWWMLHQEKRGASEWIGESTCQSDSAPPAAQEEGEEEKEKKEQSDVTADSTYLMIWRTIDFTESSAKSSQMSQSHDCKFSNLPFA